jgi:hypothetical protein
MCNNQKKKKLIQPKTMANTSSKTIPTTKTDKIITTSTTLKNNPKRSKKKPYKPNPQKRFLKSPISPRKLPTHSLNPSKD